MPKAFIGESGVLKKRTDDTMTTTRLRELVTEWVTGDTLANKLYETCQETNRNFVIGNHMWNKIHCKTNRSLCRETLYIEGSKCKLFNITEDSTVFELENMTTAVKQWTKRDHIYIINYSLRPKLLVVLAFRCIVFAMHLDISHV